MLFDPEGADFTGWINHFKAQVYQNWIVPEEVLRGARGHVDLEFTIERDGSISALRFLTRASRLSLERAAQAALANGRFLPLPADYRPPRVTMQIAFFYNERPRR